MPENDDLSLMEASRCAAALQLFCKHLVKRFERSCMQRLWTHNFFHRLWMDTHGSVWLQFAGRHAHFLAHHPRL